MRGEEIGFITKGRPLFSCSVPLLLAFLLKLVLFFFRFEAFSEFGLISGESIIN